MKSRALTLVYGLCLLCITSVTAAGEQRVLLSFDNAGHHVRHVVKLKRTTTTNPLTKNPLVLNLERPDINALMRQLQPGVALLVWTDNEGYAHLHTREPDPRISHAPAHINRAGASRLGQAAGAWLITGPDVATMVTILLPSDPSLGLASEQWAVSLVQE